jgi:hypothetical protein
MSDSFLEKHGAKIWMLFVQAQRNPVLRPAGPAGIDRQAERERLALLMQVLAGLGRCELAGHRAHVKVLP